jgi:hypothetical protein
MRIIGLFLLMLYVSYAESEDDNLMDSKLVSVMEIKKNKESLVNTTIRIHGYICVLPFTTVSTYPHSYQSQYVIRDSACCTLSGGDKVGGCSRESSIKIYADTTIYSDTPYPNKPLRSIWLDTTEKYLGKNVKIEGMLRKGTLGTKYYYYIEIKNIRNVSVDIKNNIKESNKKIKTLNSSYSKKLYIDNSNSIYHSLYNVQGKNIYLNADLAKGIHFLNRTQNKSYTK